ncbi:hypothetical protein M9H77_28655 [Catharanthus roseus]|uniref:Uncharacterized protein n=1 Tax=Catharanthus roseus TaxID=4058 RepID=A0ACC0AFX9_CATRO|nr:hypothetical protein M9H77_28655 [Catharanthus roseus]
MAVNSRNSAELLIPKTAWNKRSETINSETTSNIITGTASVIYYLSRNGHLEHPHFIEVPLSSSHGLYLRDVMNRLNFLRGNGMPYLYSWSSKRSYKNGYVWQDLSENDLIKPTNGSDYILKGSEILMQSALNSRSNRENSLNIESNESSIRSRRKKHQSWSSFEIENSSDYRNEYYRVFKCESNRELGGKSADIATQTEEKRREKTVELSREELSPPPSQSSSEGQNGMSVVNRTAENEYASGSSSVKTSRILMQLISCGSKSSGNRR